MSTPFVAPAVCRVRRLSHLHPNTSKTTLCLRERVNSTPDSNATCTSVYPAFALLFPSPSPWPTPRTSSRKSAAHRTPQPKHPLFPITHTPLSTLAQAFSITYEGDDAPRAYLYKDGAATATFPSGDSYTGGYLNRRKHGPSCTYTFTSISPASIYQGSYVDGQREGEGSLTYPDGSVYRGSFKGGQRHGWGRYAYSNGDVWVGQWEAGKKEGPGTYLYKRDGSRFDGTWVNGECSDGRWSYFQQKRFTAEVRSNRVTQYA